MSNIRAQTWIESNFILRPLQPTHPYRSGLIMDDAAMAAVALDDGGSIALLALAGLVVAALLTLLAGVVVVSGKVNKLDSSIDD